MKRHLGTILLVVAAIGLAIWLWRDKDRVTTTEAKGRSASVFPVWRREDLTELSISHEDETIVLVRESKDAVWRMKAPREERVDQAAVERALTTMEFSTIVRKVGASDQLGFEHPRASGRVKMGSLEFAFVLGGTSPRPEGSGYMKVDTADAFVCSKELADTLLANSDSYRDRSVVPYLSLDISKFEVIHATGGFVVQRFDKRSFKVPALEVLASRHALDRAWGALAEMRAEAFPKDADADRLTANPQMTIRMTPTDTSKGVAELVVGGECPGHPDDVVVLRKQPTRSAACAPKGAIDALRELTGAALVDKAPFSFRHDEIEEIRLEGGDVKPIELARKGVGFHEREPVDRELPPGEAEAVRELLTAIEKTQASAVQAGHGAPFTAIGKAKVWAGDHDETVEVSAPDKDTVTVRRVRDDARLTLSGLDARRLMARETTLRPLALSTDTRRVTRIALRCGVEQDLEDHDSGLKLVKPAGYETEGAISQLTDAIFRGKVHEWTADRDDGSFGIAADGCRVTMSFADGNAPFTLLLGGKTEGGFFGRIDGERAVFVAGRDLDVLMRTIYVNRASMRMVDADHVTAKMHGKPMMTDPQRMDSFFAERVISLGSNDVGPVDLELAITTEDGGGSRRIVCSAGDGKVRRCATSGVKAVFEVTESTIAQVVRPLTDPAISDAGTSDAR